MKNKQFGDFPKTRKEIKAFYQECADNGLDYKSYKDDCFKKKDKIISFCGRFLLIWGFIMILFFTPSDLSIWLKILFMLPFTVGCSLIVQYTEPLEKKILKAMYKDLKAKQENSTQSSCES
jgi:hypothetical protein